MPLKDISILIFSIVTSIVALKIINKHTTKKFSYEFFSESNLKIAILAFLFFLTGSYLIPKNTSFIINWMTISALFLWGISVGIIGYIVFLNFKNTNKSYGLVGSAIQIPILIIFSGPALFFIVLGKFFKALSGTSMTSSDASNKSSNEAFFANQTRARQEREWATNPNNMQNYNGVHQTNQRYYASKK